MVCVCVAVSKQQQYSYYIYFIYSSLPDSPAYYLAYNRYHPLIFIEIL